MPSADLFFYFQKSLRIVNHWSVPRSAVRPNCPFPSSLLEPGGAMLQARQRQPLRADLRGLAAEP